MRTRRIKADGNGYYHCMSRIVDSRMALGDQEKEMFRTLMRKVADFSGVQVLTYAALDNHWHILAHVPDRQHIDDNELTRRLLLLYPKGVVSEFTMKLKAALSENRLEDAQKLRERYFRRMYDISQFMKTLKQRFSTWYNRRNYRRGTLWEERFKSVLVEGGKGNSLQTSALALVGAYIDLNAVRAGIVDDPKDYRFCGYGEAVGGSTEAREGIRKVAASMNVSGEWNEFGAEYRKFLFESGQQRMSSRTGEVQRGIPLETVIAVVEQGGKLTRSEALRCRVRYFSDGVVLGSKEFVDSVFVRHRSLFGAKRMDGGRAMKWADWGGMCVLRDLRLRVIGAD